MQVTQMIVPGSDSLVLRFAAACGSDFVSWPTFTLGFSQE